ncbi:amidase [Halolactibacillus halophilus]|uniref:Amidase n=1 Tax=Halolactibacillus halophilus TaxID=306540 RepID=A0A1I5LYD7_9BACI|nr:amidase family protein [Halolactibacillus halophilus]GEM00940.1 amidase [Halolactibacillus halophilus]SFP02285.1 amidase [Halolactibacillus halophilus]
MSFNSTDYLQSQINKQYHQQPELNSVVRTLGELLPLDANITDDVIKKIITSDIDTLQMLVKEQHVSYADIAAVFYNRVVLHKDYHAVISLNHAVVEKAKQCAYSDDHDPLYGIPVLVKDNVSTTDLPTTAGAVRLKDFYPKQDAEVIQSLKKKGALILGKTNLSEWANFMTTDSANGFSARGGQTMNPFGDYDVGGSSSGSAVAASLGLSPVAIGTETAGSVIYPASQNGVVGLKPTLGTVSQAGIIPIAKAHDTAGPMARNVKDCFYLFQAMTTITETLKQHTKALTDYCFGFLNGTEIKEAYRNEDDTLLAQVKAALSQQDVTVRDVLIDASAYQIDITDVLVYQFNEGVSEFFKDETVPLTLQDIYQFNQTDLTNYAPYGQDLIKQAMETKLTKEVIDQMIATHQKMATKALDEAFETIDVLVTLSNYATTLYAASGYPALTIPGLKRASGEPVGITFIMKANQDVELLHVGQLIEQISL